MTATEPTGRPIVVGVDGSPSSILALQRAQHLATALSTTLEAIHVWQYQPYMDTGYVIEVEPAENAVRVLAEATAAAFGTDVPAGLKQVARQGSAAKVLLDASHDAEILVVGSRGHGGFVGLLLGSVSSQCAEHAHCPVLVVHSRDHL
ncbi:MULTISPECIES: universal stress protein [Nocardiaceae]|jgi:nucleotide-binding universal stress UspA family protein|uniref:universal stress protein n=1 Tax=Nocardiaceae TaxID=85025 RepID=UPI00050C2D23|nr:universal stress protein [Rhodococcus fascians]MDJ0468254.1 universal stress protein [Rhodococcus fascians]